MINHVGGGGEEGPKFLLAGDEPHGGGKMCFAHATGADEDQMLFLMNKIEVCHFEEQGLGDGRGMGPVKGIEGLQGGKLGLVNETLDAVVVTTG